MPDAFVQPLSGPPFLSLTAADSGPRSEAAEGRAAQIVDNLMRASHQLRNIVADNFAELGLNEVRFAVLKIVAASAPAGCSQAELADQLQQAESSASTLVERMRTSGLLYRLRSKTDRRKRVLMLTEQGRDLVARARRQHGERMALLLRRFDARQLELLAALLELLVGELDRTAAPRERSAAAVPHEPAA